MARETAGQAPALSVVDATEKELMTLRMTLITALRDHINERGWSREEAAARLDVSARRITSLLAARANAFSLVALIDMVVNAGLRLETRVVK